MNSFSTRQLWSLVTLAIILVASGCGPARDKSGCLPTDVVDKFVRAVRARDFVTAKAQWSPRSFEELEKTYKVTFEEFCVQTFDCERFTVERAIKEKEQYWSVSFRGEYQGRQRQFAFYVAPVSNRWHLTTGEE